MAESIDTVYRIVGQEQVLQSLTRMEEGARRFGQAAQATLSPARQATMAFSSALSSMAGVMRLTGDQSIEMAGKMEQASLAISVTMVAVQSLRGVLVSMPAILAAVRLGIVALMGPIGLAIAGALALATGVQYLFNVFQANREAAAREAEALELVGAQAWGMARGLADTTTRMQEFKLTVDQTADSINKLAKELQQTKFEDIVEGIGEWKARQDALASTIDNTTSRLGFLIARNKEHIAKLREEAQATELTADQKKKLASDIKVVENELIRLNAEYRRSITNLNETTDGIRGVSDALIEQAAISAAARALARGASIDEASTAAALVRQRFGEKLSTEELARSLDALAQARKKDAAAGINWINIEFAADAALRKAAETLGQFKEPWEEGIIGPSQAAAGEFDNVTMRAEEMAKALGIDVAQALQRIKDQEGSIDWIRLELEGIDPAFRKAADALLQFKFGVDDLAINEPPRVASGFANAFEGIKDILPELKSAFADLFTDVLSNAKSFGDALVGFFRSIVNSLVSLFAGRLATNIFNFLLPALGLPRAAAGGIFPGPLVPVFAAQGGAIVDRPTLLFAGEGGEREAVIPEHLWPAFNAGRGGSGPREVVVNVNVVADVSQIPRTSPGDIQATVVLDLRTNGPISRQIRQTIPR